MPARSGISGRVPPLFRSSAVWPLGTEVRRSTETPLRGTSGPPSSLGILILKLARERLSLFGKPGNAGKPAWAVSPVRFVYQF